MLSLKHLALFLFCIVCLQMKGESNYSRTDLTTLSGLSQNDAHDILQDSYGFIWVATNDGLNRYDGFEFKTYSIGALGVKSNLILCLGEDPNKNIWIGTADKGIFYYNRKNNSFHSALDLINEDELINRLETVSHIIVDQQGKIWVYESTLHQMARINFNYDENRIESIDFFPRRLDDSELVNGITEVNQKIFVSTNSGILYFDEAQNDFTKAPATEGLYVFSMATKGNDIFFTANSLIHIFDTQSYKLKSITSQRLHGLLCWQNNDLWCTSTDKLVKAYYNPISEDFDSISTIDQYQDFYPNVISVDFSGAIWTGFSKAGIKRYEVNKKPFYRLNNYGNNHIQPIYEDLTGDLYIGTEGSGIFKTTDLEQKGTRTQPNSFTSKTIYSITQDPKTSLYYVATNLGVYQTNDLSKGQKSIIISHNMMRSLYLDGDYLWMGSYSDGIWRLNLRNQSLVKINIENSSIPSNIVRNIVCDTKGNLWFATATGLVLINNEDKSKELPSINLILPEQTANHYVIPITEDHKGNIWYGTLGEGLFKLTPIGTDDRFSISHFGYKDGFDSQSIKSIIEDQEHQLWISSNRGISRFNPETKKVLNFDYNDGLQDYEFNELSGKRLSNGLICFGGVNGLNYFNPSNLQIDTTLAVPVLTDFRIFNESLSTDSTLYSQINGSSETLDRIHLDHDQNTFTFAFSALHFSNSKKNNYIYTLDGFDEVWYKANTNLREAHYTNVPPGNYTFKLKVSNGDGIWNEEALSVDITIDSPIWLTIWAQIFYLIILALGISAIYKFNRNRFEQKNKVALSQFEKKKMEEMLEIRTRLFTNISHEFRTPLTLIMSSLQKMQTEASQIANKKWHDSLQVMLYNSEALMRLINELLSFSKSEEGNLNVQLAYNDLNRLCGNLINQFSFWAEQKEIELVYHAPSHSVMHHYDNHLMQQIIYNLLSNAIKNTPSQGHIGLTLKDSSDEIIIIIKDTGLGISEELQKHIFERFYSVQNDASKDTGGTGIGLSLTKELVELHDGKITLVSSPDQGTTFTITIPKVSMEMLEDGVEKIDQVEHTNDYDFVSNIGATTSLAEDGAKTEEVSHERQTILIVDDHKQIQNLLTDLLIEDFNIITANDGLEALEKAQQETPDMIISDVMMPRMNGLEMCDRIKTDVRTSHIPIIMLSAKASPDDKAEGYRHHADGYVTKPFNNHVLIERVNSILYNRRRIARNHPTLEEKNEQKIMISNDITTNTDKIFMKKLTDYIEENIHNSELVVNDLCEKMGVTPIVLNKKLKSLFNMTANALIRTIRLKRAASLLKTGRYMVADVTYDVGFSDLRYFRECFKKEFGMLPQEYKDKHLNSEDIQDIETPNKAKSQDADVLLN